MKHADADLLSIIEHKVPPIEIADVCILRSVAFKFKRQARFKKTF